MKRSLLVGLSLSFVLFTMVASITSTVAWFSSTRVAYTSAGNFEVVQVDGSMGCTLGAGVGTRISSDGKHVLVGDSNPNIKHFLSDGSVDLNTGCAYRLDSDNAGYKDLGVPNSSSWLCQTDVEDEVTTKYFVAVSWTIDFSYSFRSESSSLGVYLNLKTSTMSARAPTKSAEEGQEEKSQYGFRIAFRPTGGGNFVFGNSKADPTELKYVTGLDSEDVEHYTASNYVTYGPDKPVYDDGENHTDAPERLCTLSPTSTHNLVTCIAWFEGEDPNVIHGTQMDVMDVYLSFYARSDA